MEIAARCCCISASIVPGVDSEDWVVEIGVGALPRIMGTSESTAGCGIRIEVRTLTTEELISEWSIMNGFSVVEYAADVVTTVDASSVFMIRVEVFTAGLASFVSKIRIEVSIEGEVAFNIEVGVCVDNGKLKRVCTDVKVDLGVVLEDDEETLVGRSLELSALIISAA